MKKTNILKNRNYRYLWLGQASSVMGDWFNQVSLAQTVLFLSNSALSVGILLMCRALPAVILGPFVGPYVDRLPKKKTMVMTDLLRGVTVATFIFAFLFEQIWLLYVGSVVIGLLSMFFNPSRQATIPMIVSREKLAEANAFSSATNSFVTILGSILGGILSAIAGPLICFTLNACSYFWSALCIFQMKWSENKSTVTSVPYGVALKEGFREATQNPVIRAVIWIGISWGFAGGGYQILIPLLGSNVYDMQGFGIGALYAVDGLGVLTGAYLVKQFIKDQHRRAVIWYGASYLIQALFFVLLTQTETLFWGVLMLYFMRISSGVIIPLDSYMLQTHTQEEVRGRVFSLHLATYGGFMQLSYILSGLAYEQWGIPYVGWGIGIVSFVCGTSWLIQYRQGKLTSSPSAVPMENRLYK